MQDPLIDELDLRLIHALQTRARIPWTTLAGILRVDAATLMRRWRRLVDHGYVYVTALIPLQASKLALAFVEIACQPVHAVALAEELAKDHGVVSIDLTASGRTMLVTLIGHDLDAISNWTMTLGLDPRVVALQTHHVSELVTDASLWRPKALSQTEELAVRAWPPRNTATTNLALPELVTLLELLSQDIRAPIAALAEGSGLSRRRVSESLNAMTASGELVVRIDVARRLTPFPRVVKAADTILTTTKPPTAVQTDATPESVTREMRVDQALAQGHQTARTRPAARREPAPSRAGHPTVAPAR